MNLTGETILKQKFTSDKIVINSTKYIIMKLKEQNIVDDYEIEKAIDQWTTNLKHAVMSELFIQIRRNK